MTRQEIIEERMRERFEMHVKIVNEPAPRFFHFIDGLSLILLVSRTLNALYLCTMKWMILFVSLSLMTSHKYYVSHTDAYWNEESSSIEMASRFFIDDVERALQMDGVSAHIEGDMDSELLPIIHSFYIDDLEVSSDGDVQKIHFLGYETDNEFLWVYAEVLDIPSKNELSIKASWLHDVFEEQLNIINLEFEESISTVHLSREQPRETIALQ